EVCLVGYKALFAGADRIEDSLAGEGFVFEDAEATAVEGQAARIGDPQCALRTRESGAFVPDRDFFGGDRRLNDRHQRGAVFLNGDGYFEFVLEEVAEFLGDGGGFWVCAGGFWL